jgi:hypothetical protein
MSSTLEHYLSIQLILKKYYHAGGRKAAQSTKLIIPQTKLQPTHHRPHLQPFFSASTFPLLE